MAYQIFPAVVASSGGGASTSFFTVANSNRYWANVDLSAGVYNFAGTVSHANCEVALLDANDAILTTITVAGTTPVVVTASSTIKKLRFVARPYRTSDDRTPMGSIQIGVTLVGALNNTTGFTGTAALYTTTQPISINGTAYVFVIGGGGGSNSNTTGYNTTGGASGALVEKYATNWSGLYTVTVGNGGGTGGGGTTTLTNTGGTVMSAGGGQGSSNPGNNDRNYHYLPANSGGDFAGFSGGGAGSNQGNAGYQPFSYPYPAKFQWARQFTVQGGVGGGAGADFATGFGNGTAGYSGASNATGMGNGGGGSANSTGSAGGVIVVTGLQESI